EGGSRGVAIAFALLQRGDAGEDPGPLLAAGLATDRLVEVAGFLQLAPLLGELRRDDRRVAVVRIELPRFGDRGLRFFLQTEGAVNTSELQPGAEALAIERVRLLVGGPGLQPPLLPLAEVSEELPGGGILRIEREGVQGGAGRLCGIPLGQALDRLQALHAG